MTALQGIAPWIVLGLVLLITALFLPKYGLIGIVRTALEHSRRAQLEDALKYLLERRMEGSPAHEDSLKGALGIRNRAYLRLRFSMESEGLLKSMGRRLDLTPKGEGLAVHIIRAHRIWEHYLATEAMMPLTRIHRTAHRLEHKTSTQEVRDMEAALGYPRHDPHGDPIPDRSGEFPPDKESVPLTSLKAGERGIIMHIEDEPPIVYAQILAEGLAVGDMVSVIDVAPERITMSRGLDEIRLAPAFAGHILLSVEQESELFAENVKCLSQLPDGKEGIIVAIQQSCQGFTRRRFMDLGLTPGTRLYPELRNAFGEPRAYRVRGTLVALRNDQADNILIRETEGPAVDKEGGAA